LAASLELETAPNRNWRQNKSINSSSKLDELLSVLPWLVKPALWREGKKELGFTSLFTDGNGDYWIKCSRGFHTSLNESLASVEALIDELGDDVDIEKKHIVNQTYRRLSDYLN
jgi:regulation of enolase protein 1 (concanavalin A-like superfamily)